MNSGRAAVAWALGVILLLSLATGPLVGVVSIPDRQTFGGSDLGEGSATVTDVRYEGSVRLESGSYGSGVYHLRAPPVRFHVTNVTGRPMLIYRLDIDGLGYSRQTNVALDRRTAGARTVELSAGTFDRDEITRKRYNGTLRLVLRGDGPDRTVFERPVTVVVNG